MLHLNGAPGVGKSTLARRWAAEHPGTLDLDIDVLRTLVGGWQQDFAGAGGMIRPVALAALSAHLAEGRDVVLPQLIARPSELERFRAAAGEADYVHVLLTAPRTALEERLAARLCSGDAVEATVAAVLLAAGGRAQLDRFEDLLRVLVAGDPAGRVVETVDGDPDATYAALVAVVG